MTDVRTEDVSLPRKSVSPGRMSSSVTLQNMPTSTEYAIVNLSEEGHLLIFQHPFFMVCFLPSTLSPFSICYQQGWLKRCPLHPPSMPGMIYWIQPRAECLLEWRFGGPEHTYKSLVDCKLTNRCNV